MKLKVFTKSPILAAFFFFSLFACVSDNEEDLFGLLIYDTSNVTWEYPIQQILEQNCVYCHNADVHYKNVRHDTYTEELKVVVDGRLRGVVNHLPTYTRMPYQRAKLKDEEVELINIWIDRGAPEK